MFSKQLYERLHNDLLKRPLQVYEIFKNFFGEELVDYNDYYSLDIVQDYFNYHSESNNILNEINTFISKCNTYLEDFSEEELDTFAEDANNYSNLLEEMKNTTSNHYAISIFIKFPHVKIENEEGNSLDIEDLFAKINIDSKGCIIGTFTLCRTTYDRRQWAANYMHSHIKAIRRYEYYEEEELNTYFGHNIGFRIPCLGTGPIKYTILTLSQDNDADIWNLFCLELSRYVKNESLKGGPYHRLGTITKQNLTVYSLKNFDSTVCDPLNNYLKSFFYSDLLKDIYLRLEKHLIINNGYIDYNFSPLDYLLYFSKAFIDFYNLHQNYRTTFPINVLLKRKILLKSVIKDNKYFILNNLNEDEINNEEYEGLEMFKFKGVMQYLHINEGLHLLEEQNIIYTLSPIYISTIRAHILNVLNYTKLKNKINGANYGFNKGKIQFL